MAFFASADAYDRFMGRYSRILSPLFADLAGIREGMRVLDVGCGPGVLTDELVTRTGAANVSAIDPSEPFVEAVRERHPGLDVHIGGAEALPFADDTFDAAVSQLVVHFMTDPVAGLREMARVTRPGGVVAACTWDITGGRSPMSPFWRAAREVDPAAAGESYRRGTSEADLAGILAAAGLAGVATTELAAEAAHASFDEWWQPFELGVGPTGVYLQGLDAATRARIRERARRFFPEGPLTVTWYVWAARAVVG